MNPRRGVPTMYRPRGGGFKPPHGFGQCRCPTSAIRTIIRGWQEAQGPRIIVHKVAQGKMRSNDPVICVARTAAWLCRCPAAGLAALLLTAAVPAGAVDFRTGPVNGALDLNLSYGAMYRTEDRNEGIVAKRLRKKHPAQSRGASLPLKRWKGQGQ